MSDQQKKDRIQIITSGIGEVTLLYSTYGKRMVSKTMPIN